MTESHFNQPSLDEFALVATDYCGFIESLRDGRPQKFYTDLELLLARLHISILPLIAEVNESKMDLLGSARLGHEQWTIVSEQVAQITNEETSQLLEWHEHAWNTAKLDDNYCAIRASMLWDDLADIYLDLKNGLNCWAINTNESKIEAAWEWRFGFDSHWGTHLARAMQTVHEARYHLYAN